MVSTPRTAPVVSLPPWTYSAYGRPTVAYLVARQSVDDDRSAQPAGRRLLDHRPHGIRLATGGNAVVDMEHVIAR